ncbi:hypothetical protein [Gimesia sp.]|uniref:hypothetical protein n=1 Tax=Gimesia sp. TaxID=2024833 RepID=UPI003A90027E
MKHCGKQIHWAEELPEYSLDACLTKPPHRYRVVGRENRYGKTLILVEYLNEPHEQSPEKCWRTRAWVDPSQGYLPFGMKSPLGITNCARPTGRRLKYSKSTF